MHQSKTSKQTLITELIDCLLQRKFAAVYLTNQGSIHIKQTVSIVCFSEIYLARKHILPWTLFGWTSLCFGGWGSKGILSPGENLVTSCLDANESVSNSNLNKMVPRTPASLAWVHSILTVYPTHYVIANNALAFCSITVWYSFTRRHIFIGVSSMQWSYYYVGTLFAATVLRFYHCVP